MSDRKCPGVPGWDCPEHFVTLFGLFELWAEGFDETHQWENVISDIERDLNGRIDSTDRAYKDSIAKEYERISSLPPLPNNEYWGDNEYWEDYERHKILKELHDIESHEIGYLYHMRTIVAHSLFLALYSDWEGRRKQFYDDYEVPKATKNEIDLAMKPYKKIRNCLAHHNGEISRCDKKVINPFIDSHNNIDLSQGHIKVKFAFCLDLLQAAEEWHSKIVKSPFKKEGNLWKEFAPRCAAHCGYQLPIKGDT